MHADIQLEQQHLLNFFSYFHRMVLPYLKKKKQKKKKKKKKKNNVHNCAGLFLGPHFDSIDQPLCLDTKIHGL